MNFDEVLLVFVKECQPKMAGSGVVVAHISWSICSKSVVAVVIFYLAKIAVRAATKTQWYKNMSAIDQKAWIDLTKGMFMGPKQELFAHLRAGLEKVNGDVVEIGIGSGANFDYYLNGTSVIAVDANPYVEKLLRKRLEDVDSRKRIYLKKFVAASAEDMSCRGEIGIADDSVAAVVCTKLLCSLTEDQIRKTVREAKRVLKPGGRFYFLEHVADTPGTLRYYMQQIVSLTRLWPTLYDGCCCNVETIKFIQQGDFKHISFKRLSVECPAEMSRFRVQKVIQYFVAPVVTGYAEK